MILILWCLEQEKFCQARIYKFHKSQMIIYLIIKEQIVFQIHCQEFKEKSITEVKEVARAIWKWLHLQHLPDLAFLTT